MSGGEHTPWVALRDDSGGEIGLWSVVDAQGHVVFFGMDEATARLFAAAPELITSLKWMVEHDDTNDGDTPLEDHGGRTWNEINAYWIDGVNRARAAIAKAEVAK